MYYSWKLPNYGTVDRQWSVYSQTKDAIFCFCCKLFAKGQIKLDLEDMSKWKHIDDYLKSHDASKSHIDAHKTWSEFENRSEGQQQLIELLK